jgi:hypothetical protein
MTAYEAAWEDVAAMFDRGPGVNGREHEAVFHIVRCRVQLRSRQRRRTRPSNRGAIRLLIGLSLTLFTACAGPLANGSPGEPAWLLVKNPRVGDAPGEPEYVWVQEDKVPVTWATLLLGERTIIAPREVVERYGPPPGGGPISRRQGVAFARPGQDLTKLRRAAETVRCWAGSSVVPASQSVTGLHIVELRSGETIRGVLKEWTAAGAVLDVGGQRISFPAETVRTIRFHAGPDDGPSVREAISTLRSLQSVTTSATNYQNYAPRVIDAKIAIDSYLRRSSGDPEPLRDAICVAMHYYVLASSAWEMSRPLLNLRTE